MVGLFLLRRWLLCALIKRETLLFLTHVSLVRRSCLYLSSLSFVFRVFVSLVLLFYATLLEKLLCDNNMRCDIKCPAKSACVNRRYIYIGVQVVVVVAFFCLFLLRYTAT